jgi:predicted DsbA family dithiol-disulfide isomerase
MIKLLTTHCPRCSVLQKKLDAAGIEYEEITDIETIQSYGVDAVPVLVIDNEIFDFTAAVKWVNDYNGGNQ